MLNDEPAAKKITSNIDFYTRYMAFFFVIKKLRIIVLGRGNKEDKEDFVLAEHQKFDIVVSTTFHYVYWQDIDHFYN